MIVYVRLCARFARSWRTGASSFVPSTISGWRAFGFARYTTLVDQAISRIFEAYLSELSEARSDEIRQRVALVAHGGYGRRQQAPFSDVDLMMLYDGNRDALIGQLASRLTQDICDVYQHLGHSLRTPAEAVRAGPHRCAGRHVAARIAAADRQQRPVRSL